MHPCNLVTVHPTQSPETNKVKIRRCNNLCWSLEPMARWMCLVGIPLSIDGSRCRLKLPVSYFIRAFCFILNLIIHSSQTVHMFFNARDIASSYVTGTSSLALSWNFIIESAVVALYAVGGHISLLVLTRSEAWTDLINSFKILDQNLPSDDIYPVSRQLATRTLFYVISSVLCVDLLLGVDMIYNDNTLMRKIMDLSSFFTKIYPMTALGLFSVLTRIVSLQLKAIRNRIEDQLKQRHQRENVTLINEDVVHRSQLKTLRRHHRLICGIVRQLNSCFGFFLLFEVSFIFITSINCSMYLFSSATTSDRTMGLLYTVICIDCLIHLFLITSFSDDIATQTDNVQEVLTELLDDQPSLQNEVTSVEVTLFSEQLTRLKTNIHALGFFDVNKHIFPSLIGTTLTYFIILLQFHSAEKS